MTDQDRLISKRSSVTETARDMRREIVLREINEGALAGMSSQITEQAADLIVTALDRYDEYLLRIAVDKLVLAALKAARAIPDGEIRNGCLIYDGARVREGLREAVNGLIELSPRRTNAPDQRQVRS